MKRQLLLIELIWELFSKHISILKPKYYLAMFTERALFCLEFLLLSTTLEQTINVNFCQNEVWKTENELEDRANLYVMLSLT